MEFTQRETETRKQFLVRIAISFIEEHSQYVGVDYDMKYDESTNDGYALAEDLRIEFDIED